MRNQIMSLVVESGMDEDCYTEMLDYTIELFETQGLGSDYYGYHNINHELEVTYVSLLSANLNNTAKKFSDNDLKYLYVAALFHDFDPQKSVDKPHEESVLRFISMDKRLRKLLDIANLDLELIKVLILITTYPWSGQIKEKAELQIKECFRNSELTKNNEAKQEHFINLGWYLSVVDRISGYAVGDFSKAMEMAKMNAHALAWKPSLIVRSSVAYFEELLNKETEMSQFVLKSLPKHMRKNFFDTVLSFMNIRQQEITIQANYTYDNLKLVPTIENIETRKDPEFIKSIYTIFLESLALKMGYWGLKGGSEMRHMFVMQAHAKKYKYLTSFALRDVIKSRIDKEDAEFVASFDN